MKKTFQVYVDITYSVSVNIEAENEEEAMAMAEEKVGKDPRYWTQSGAIANISAYDVDGDMEEEAAQ